MSQAAPAAAATAATSSSAAKDKASRSGSTTTEENYKLRVFVGNLPWSIDEEGLKTLFADAGKITEVNVASFRTRSLGFGFVQFSSEAEAARAVQMFKDKNVEGRQLNVEHAKSPAQIQNDRAEKGAQREARPRRSRGRGRGQAAEGGAASGASSSSPQAGGAAKADGEGAPKRRRRPRGKKPAGENGEKVQSQQSSSSSSNNGGEGGEKKPRRRRSRREGGDAAAGTTGENAKPANAEPKEESDTTVFVANLPFDCDDAKLANLFGGLSLNKAYVVVKRNGRSKGFGFAEFKDKNTQQAAINKVNNVELDGRPLSVRAAYKYDEAKATSSSAE